MKNTLIGILAGVIILFCAFYIGVSVKQNNFLGFLTATVLTSQSKPGVLVAQANTPNGPELYAIIRGLNDEIDKTSSGKEVVEAESVVATLGSSGVQTISDSEKVAAPSKAEKVIDLSKLQTLLSQRKGLMLMLAKVNPRLFILSVLSESTKAKIPVSLQSEIEKYVSVTGKIEVIHVDDFEKPENSRFEYFLRVGEERFTLYLSNTLYAVSGETYKIKGIKLSNAVVADYGKIEKVMSTSNPDSPEPPVLASPPDSVGEQKTLVLLINFLDSTPSLMSAERMRGLIFDGKLNRFYKEQSYGKTFFTGDVSGWHTLPRNKNDLWPSVDRNNNEIEDIIISNGIDLSNYSRLLLVVDWRRHGGWGTVGKTPIWIQNREYLLSVGWIGSFFQDYLLTWPGRDPLGPNPFEFSMFDFVASHEVGHNLGVAHANGFDCGENTLSGECNHVEYGNFFDTMGYGVNSLHFNAFYKELLGWVAPQNRVLVSRSGRYTINPLEIPLESEGRNIAKNFAKIQRHNSNTMSFYLEYRKGVGFDSQLNSSNLSSNQSGLFVNRIWSPPIQNPFPRLLDMMPTSEQWYEDLSKSTLNVGKMFRDPLTGITIGPVIESSTSSITFDVKIEEPSCVRDNPILLPTGYQSPVGLGQTSSVNLQFGNGDSIGCSQSKFNAETSISDSWFPRIDPPDNILIFPDEYGQALEYKSIIFTVPINTEVGMYPVVNSVVNETTGRRTKEETNIEVVYTPVISAVEPKLGGSIGTNVTITGSNLSSFPDIWLASSEGYVMMSRQSNGTAVNFEVPAFIMSYNCPQLTCPIPTPLGVYSLYVHSDQGIASNPVNFKVIQ
ncbi:MAG: IPT/TIG domain-containing protein [Patescibacteria group bacterium]